MSRRCEKMCRTRATRVEYQCGEDAIAGERLCRRHSAQRARGNRANAWRDYARHLEWCRPCAEDPAGTCSEGTALKQTAEQHEAELDASKKSHQKKRDTLTVGSGGVAKGGGE